MRRWDSLVGEGMGSGARLAQCAPTGWCGLSSHQMRHALANVSRDFTAPRSQLSECFVGESLSTAYLIDSLGDPGGICRRDALVLVLQVQPR